MKRVGSTLDDWVKKKPKFEPSYLTQILQKMNTNQEIRL
jgi:hypothetical protein